MSVECIGVDVGGTKIAVATLRDGDLSEPRVQLTATTEADALLDEIVAGVEAARGEDAVAVGVGVPSVIDFEAGAARTSVNVPLAGVPLRDLLRERLGLPVFVDNDATLAAFAEAHDGGRLAVRNLVMLTVGTGVGGGLVLAGEPYRGSTGAAGELGHTLIGLDLSDDAPAAGSFPQEGSLESLAAGSALDRLAARAAAEHPGSHLGRQRAGGEEITGEDAVEAALAGDEIAVGLLERLGARLGIGIANAINALDPEVVAIGGGVSAAGELLLEPARRTAQRFVLPGVGTRTEIRLSRHGYKAGVLGAALLAKQELKRQEGSSLMAATATTDLDELAVNTIRTLSMDAVQKANSGHPGSPMGLAPLGYVLYSQVMQHNPANPAWPNRDRFVLSAGHACMLQYSLLHLCGYDLSLDDIKSFRQWGSRCPGHPEYGRTPGIEISTGPLGQGVANAVGFALAEAHQAANFNRGEQRVVDHHTFVVCGDGDMEEGISSEAASLAGNLGLGKLIAIYDDNEIQIEGSTHLAFREKVAGRFEAYGWSVRQLERDSTLEEIRLALEEAKGESAAPSLIVLPSHIGYGSPNKQDTAAAHGSPLGEEEVKLTKQSLGWPYEEPFTVPAEVYELFAGVRERGIEAEREWSQLFEAYAAEHPDLAGQLERVNGRHEPNLPPLSEAPAFSSGDDPIATRAASGKALNWLAPQVPELLGGAADLAPSTATHLEDYPDLLRHDFGGRNLHFGVREHAMGAIVNALTVEGLRAYGATFLVFSDYMRGAIRMAALMEIPSIFVFTHDSIGVGEDGPTHQPIEQLASLRAMPNLEVIRPADVNETFLAWHWLLGASSVPTALVLSRQKLPVLDRASVPDDAIARGGYVCSDPEGGEEPELILIGTGSELSLCLDAAELLGDGGLMVRVVSMPSTSRFKQQEQAYRDEVLPPGVRARISVEAGSTLGWGRWVGDGGERIGLDHFGASAPAGEIAEHFGLTPEAVAERARALVGEGS